MSIDAMKQALQALEELNKVSIGVDAVCLPGEIDTAMDALRLAIEQAERQEPVQCEPQPAVTEDGYCDWVCPNPASYLMQCCDCGLIHEVQTRVAKYEPRPSETYEVVSDPDVQAQWRMRRRDDISPKQAEQQEPVAWEQFYPDMGKPQRQFDPSLGEPYKVQSGVKQKSNNT